jgi:signal transduction histidine kinase
MIRRQIALFLLAIVGPCAGLGWMAVRMATQERELATKRRADEGQRRTETLRQLLTAYLERTNLQLASDLAGGRTLRPDASAALVAWVDQQHLVLPWDGDERIALARAAIEAPTFSSAIREAERTELLARRPAAAAAQYARVAAASSNPTQIAYAGLLQARALAAAGQAGSARTVYLSLLTPSSAPLVDEYGVPFWSYAAHRLTSGPSGDPRADDAVILERIDEALAPGRQPPPTACHLWGDIAGVISSRAQPAESRTRATDVRERARRAAREAEQAVALQAAFPLEGLSSPSRPGGAVWVRFGDPLWLVGVSAPRQPGRAVLVAVRAEPALAAALAGHGDPRLGFTGARLVTSGSGGDWLGESFPGLRVAYAAPVPDDTSRTAGPWFYWTIVLLVVTVTISGGYFLWRDVHRELRIAALRSQFVSSVSHELKTPLTAIRMFAETLLMGRARDGEIAAEYLETIVNESERLTRLLNNVLEFSKLERGTSRFHMAPHAIADVVQRTVRAMSYPLAQQGFTLSVNVEDGLPPVPMDPDALEQALLNLLTNAMKYSGAARTIGLAVGSREGRLIIDVTDHGLGIAAEDHGRVFEKFYRAATPENRHIPGTGLGLTLVEHIARAHGGVVTLESAPGEGSRFSLVLPITQAQAAEASAGTSTLLDRSSAAL